MRRRAPRRLADVLPGVSRPATPATTLAQVQACWNGAVGPAIAGEAQPLSERDGELTVGCRSATWASEIELLAPELLAKLNGALAEAGARQLTRLRAKVAKLP